MGALLVCDAGAVANPGANFTSVPAGAGSTFTVRGTSISTSQRLVSLVRGGATKGSIRVRSPYLVDNVNGIRAAVAAGIQQSVIPHSTIQQLRAQDTLTVEVTGGAAEDDGALLTTYYDDLAGASPVLKMPGDVIGQAVEMASWEVDAAASATIGAWGATAISALYDNSLANRWYAVLGYAVDTPVLGVALNGADTSNFNIGGPGLVNPYFTRDYFARLSMDLGKPCVPVFNTANKGNTTLQVVDVAASTAVNATLIIAVMPESWAP
jgi:hypothetical protein